MALAYCQQEERWARGLPIDAEHCAPLPVRLWNVVLDTTAETSPVARFGFAWAQRVDRDAISLQGADCGLNCGRCRLRGASQILGKHLSVYPEPKAQTLRSVADG